MTSGDGKCTRNCAAETAAVSGAAVCEGDAYGRPGTIKPCALVVSYLSCCLASSHDRTMGGMKDAWTDMHKRISPALLASAQRKLDSPALPTTPGHAEELPVGPVLPSIAQVFALAHMRKVMGWRHARQWALTPFASAECSPC